MTITLEEGEDQMKYPPTSLPSLYKRSDPLSRSEVSCSLLLQLLGKPAWVTLAPNHGTGTIQLGLDKQQGAVSMSLDTGPGYCVQQ